MVYDIINLVKDCCGLKILSAILSGIFQMYFSPLLGEILSFQCHNPFSVVYYFSCGRARPVYLWAVGGRAGV